MLDSREGQAILNNIYRAALDVTAWNDVVRDLERLLGNSPSVIHSIDNRLNVVSTTSIGAFDPDFVRSFAEYYAALSPWTKQISSARPQEVRVYSPDRSSEFLRSEFYQDWILPQEDLNGGAGVRTRQIGGRSMFFGINIRGKYREKYDPLAQAWLTALEPHLSHSFSVNEVIADLNAKLAVKSIRTEAGAALPPTLPGGMLLLSANRQVLWMDAEAPRLLGSILRLDLLGRVNFINNVASDWLQSVMTLIERDQGHVTQLLELRPKIMGGHWTLRALPCKYGVEQLTAGRHLALPFGYAAPCLVLVVSPAAASSTAEDVLRKKLGLSHSEWQVAISLANGATTQSIADMRGVTVNTVRNQLRTILAKTGTHSRSDIIRLLYAAGVREK